MHAVVVQVTVHDPDSDTARLRDEIVPRVSQAPGFVTGYWLRTGDDKGLSVIVFESEDAAQGAAEMIQAAPRTDEATLDGVDVREVVAHA
jgi:heme-degrading monooxygenase HmoA